MDSSSPCHSIHCEMMSNTVRRGTNSLFGLSSIVPTTSQRSSGKEIGLNNMRITPHQGLRFITASTPREDVMVATEPLTTHDLVTYLASGCKPKEKWRIGTEHEKIGFDFGTLRPIQIEQISDLLNGIAERFSWEKSTEGIYTVGLKQGMKTVTLEGGGQLELSGAPVETLHETCDEIKSHLHQVNSICKEMGIGFLGIGSQPKWGLKDVPHMPKRRCEVLTSNYSKTVVQTTTSVQVNLDFSSESDMIKKYRVSLALQPVVTAMFANSPFSEGKPNGFLSFRSHAYTESDPRRTGMIPFVFDDSFGFEQYVEYALDVPLFMLYRNKKYIDCGSGSSFRAFMKGKLPCLPGEFPTIVDWENHISTIWPEVRLKKYLEMRGADTGTFWNLCAVPALWVGLLYDEVNLQKLVDITADWTSAERETLRNTVPKSGLQTPFRDAIVNDVAEYILQLAKDGLDRRGYRESKFLDPLIEVVSGGVTHAEKLLEMYHGKWSNSVDPMFDELLY